jgi:hypothetical protein
MPTYTIKGEATYRRTIQVTVAADNIAAAKVAALAAVTTPTPAVPVKSYGETLVPGSVHATSQVIVTEEPV